VQNIEFTLEPRFRAHLLRRAITAVILGLLIGAFGLSKHLGFITAVSVLCLLYAAASVAVWFCRGRFVTRLTDEGIEVRRYVTKLLPWSEIREIQTYDFARVAPMRVAAGRSNRSRNTSTGGTKTVACVKVVLASGRKVKLPAPLATRAQSDHLFAEKVRTIKSFRRTP
jgi:hypothetical protein